MTDSSEPGQVNINIKGQHQVSAFMYVGGWLAINGEIDRTESNSVECRESLVHAKWSDL